MPTDVKNHLTLVIREVEVQATTSDPSEWLKLEYVAIQAGEDDENPELMENSLLGASAENVENSPAGPYDPATPLLGARSGGTPHTCTKRYVQDWSETCCSS